MKLYRRVNITLTRNRVLLFWGGGRGGGGEGWFLFSTMESISAFYKVRLEDGLIR